MDSTMMHSRPGTWQGTCVACTGRVGVQSHMLCLTCGRAPPNSLEPPGKEVLVWRARARCRRPDWLAWARAARAPSRCIRADAGLPDALLAPEWSADNDEEKGPLQRGL